MAWVVGGEPRAALAAGGEPRAALTVLHVGRVGDEERSRLLAAAARAEPTVALDATARRLLHGGFGDEGNGASRDDPVQGAGGGPRRGRIPPTRQRTVELGAVEVGTAAVFERVRRALLAWRVHLGAAVRVTPTNQPPEPGTTVVLEVGLGPLTAVAPCRVVDVVDRPGRFGFLYATLPGHPLRGMECFVVQHHPGGVRFEITARSEPAGLLVRLGRPVLGHLQHRLISAYLDAARRAAVGRVD